MLGFDNQNNIIEMYSPVSETDRFITSQLFLGPSLANVTELFIAGTHSS